MNADCHFLSLPRPQRECAFTLTELLVVVAVVGLLLTLRIVALASAKDQTLRGQCAGHLRQLALVTTIIAADNGDKLPYNYGSFWAWDMAWNVGNTYTNYMPLQALYCPASGFSYDDNNGLWSYAVGNLHVIGYAQTFFGNASLNVTNFNATLTPQRIQTIPFNANHFIPAPIASQRVLFADAVMSLPGQNNPALVSNYQWVDIVGGFPKHHRTSHMDGALPAGGNLAMLDGHVEWRNFPLMLPQAPNASAPVFWW